MIRPGIGKSCHHHVGVAHGLDLLETELLREEVEGAEDLIEDADDALGCGPLRERREVDHVGEHDGHVGVAVGDDPGLALEPFGDGPREDVEEQAFRPVEGRVARADRVLEEQVRGERRRRRC